MIINTSDTRLQMYLDILNNFTSNKNKDVHLFGSSYSVFKFGRQNGLTTALKMFLKINCNRKYLIVCNINQKIEFDDFDNVQACTQSKFKDVIKGAKFDTIFIMSPKKSIPDYMNDINDVISKDYLPNIVFWE